MFIILLANIIISKLLYKYYFYSASMETIIYTNNKREGSNYSVDRMYIISNLVFIVKE